MSDRDVDTVERAVGYWNRGDREAFLATFHPEGMWSSAIKRRVEGGEGLYRGREEIGGFWDEWHSVWDELKIVISEIRSPRDGWVLGFGTFQGLGKASRIDLEQPFGWVFQLDEDGLVREVRAYFSREEALEAAGLSE